MIKMVPSIFGKVYTTEELIQLRDEISQLIIDGGEVTASKAHREHLKGHLKTEERILKDQIEKWFVGSPKFQIDFTSKQLDQLSQFFIDEKIDFENFKGYCKDDKDSVKKFISIIGGSFFWSVSKEGSFYWDNLSNKWHKVCE